MTRSKEKTIVSHKNVFLKGDVFICNCGAERGSKHIIKFSDGSIRNECDTCFMNDVDVIRAGLLDDERVFIMTGTGKVKKKDKSDSQLLSYIPNYYSF